jgi:hypothetical protein
VERPEGPGAAPDVEVWPDPEPPTEEEARRMTGGQGTVQFVDRDGVSVAFKRYKVVEDMLTEYEWLVRIHAFCPQHVVRPLARGRDGYFMERFGQPLNELFVDMPARDRVEIVCGLCEAVQAFHALGVLHVDIKMPNALAMRQHGVDDARHVRAVVLLSRAVGAVLL